VLPLPLAVLAYPVAVLFAPTAVAQTPEPPEYVLALALGPIAVFSRLVPTFPSLAGAPTIPSSSAHSVVQKHIRARQTVTAKTSLVIKPDLTTSSFLTDRSWDMVFSLLLLEYDVAGGHYPCLPEIFGIGPIDVLTKLFERDAEKIVHHG